MIVPDSDCNLLGGYDSVFADSDSNLLGGYDCSR